MNYSRASLVSLALLHLIVASVSAQGSGTKSSWKTLSGNEPLVIARGGFSGLFADSSVNAYGLAMETSLPNVVLWCDVQLTKDGVGICLPDVKLDNSTDISDFFPKRDKEYDVNGVSTNGWFSIDFTGSDLVNVSVRQGIYSRSDRFDRNFFPILIPEDVISQVKAQNLWLNIQHDAFFTQHKLSMKSYVISLSQTPGIIINYISSPEVAFLNGIKSRFNPKTTKLVFRFLQKDQIEPSTNQTYDSLSKNLTFIKTFASGILVPKDYIWPVDSSAYLLPHTSLVSDAHKEGLEIFGANFVNDYPLSYNYSFDPIDEYLNFVDNGEFSVDGVLSDFPITASATIDCFAHLGQNASKQAKPLIISKFGSSGDYPGCTDLAYTKAIEDGVDVLDCPVQLSSDGIPFCMSSINLIDSTDAAQSQFSDRIMAVPEIKTGTGIYAFNLTWEEIQSLKPVLASPYSSRYTIFRNPKNLNAGKFITLSEFLNLTKETVSLSSILIGIENAAYLAGNQGLSVVDAVNTAMNKAGFENQTAHKIMIQSSNSNVLEKFKGKDYELVYKIDEEIRDIDEPTLKDIAGFANSVVLSKASIFPDSQLYLTGETNVVSRLQSHKLPVYVETFSNEYVSQPWDFFSDATVEINTYVSMANIDGVITDFPKTSARYKRNRCLERSGDNVPTYMSPVKPGGLLEIISPTLLPPAEAPNPILTEADVAEGPLPSTSARSPPSGPGPTNGPKKNTQPKTAALPRFSSIAALLSAAVFVF